MKRNQSGKSRLRSASSVISGDTNNTFNMSHYINNSILNQTNKVSSNTSNANIHNQSGFTINLNFNDSKNSKKKIIAVPSTSSSRTGLINVRKSVLSESVKSNISQLEEEGVDPNKNKK